MAKAWDDQLATGASPPPPPPDHHWQRGTSRPRYRILERRFGDEVIFYPQWRGWFLWHYYHDTDSNGGGYIRHKTKDGAVAYIVARRRYDRNLRHQVKTRRVVMEFGE